MPRAAAAAAIAIALFALYALGASPTIYVGDSGELAAAVHVLGIPHPTGYPLYVLLGKLWTLLLPVGSIAYALSLFSAACAALACAVLYRTGRALDLAPPFALLGALLLAFSPSFWGEANVQRVYALNALFLALATWLAVRWYARPSRHRLLAVLLVCGLGAANHTFMAVYAAVFAVGVLLRIAVRARRVGLGTALRRLQLASGGSPFVSALRTATAAIASFALGLAPYLYLPLRSRADPPLDWGNPESFDGLLGVVLRRGFWQRAWVETPLDALAVAADYLASLPAELTWPGAALAAVGLVAGRRQRWPRLLFVLVMLGNLAIMASHGSRSDLFIWHRYYIPTYAMAALLAGCGCRALLERAPAAARLAPLAVPMVMLAIGWQAADRSRYQIAEAYSRAVLEGMPPGATLIATDDNILFVLIYLTMVERLRPDVNLVLQGVGAADLQPLRFDPDVDPVFFTHHPNWRRADLDIVPVGLAFQARRPSHPPPPPAALLDELPGENDAAVPKDYLTANLIGQFHYMRGFNLEQRDWRRADAEFRRAATAAPDNDVLLYNLGLLYERNGLLDDAAAMFERSAAINPRDIPGGRARAGDRLRQLDVERQRWAELERALAADPRMRGLAPDSPAYHAALAALLDARGEPTAARGHRLRAERRGAGAAPECVRRLHPECGAGS